MVTILIMNKALWNLWLLLVTLQIQYYTTYIIALANSCQGMVDVLMSIKAQFWRPGTTTNTNDKEIATKFDAVLNVYQVSVCMHDRLFLCLKWGVRGKDYLYLDNTCMKFITYFWTCFKHPHTHTHTLCILVCFNVMVFLGSMWGTICVTTCWKRL